jgi:hypothetical protein
MTERVEEWVGVMWKQHDKPEIPAHRGKTM